MWFGAGVNLSVEFLACSCLSELGGFMGCFFAEEWPLCGGCPVGAALGGCVVMYCLFTLGLVLLLFLLLGSLAYAGLAGFGALTAVDIYVFALLGWCAMWWASVCFFCRFVSALCGFACVFCVGVLVVVLACFFCFVHCRVCESGMVVVGFVCGLFWWVALVAGPSPLV